jgi:hypothetical protein
MGQRELLADGNKLGPCLRQVDWTSRYDPAFRDKLKYRHACMHSVENQAQSKSQEQCPSSHPPTHGVPWLVASWRSSLHGRISIIQSTTEWKLAEGAGILSVLLKQVWMAPNSARAAGRHRSTKRDKVLSNIYAGTGYRTKPPLLHLRICKELARALAHARRIVSPIAVHKYLIVSPFHDHLIPCSLCSELAKCIPAVGSHGFW